MLGQAVRVEELADDPSLVEQVHERLQIRWELGSTSRSEQCGRHECSCESSMHASDGRAARLAPVPLERLGRLENCGLALNSA